MDGTGQWVALRVTRLAAPLVCARPRSSAVDPTLRAALLIDLALAGALTDGLEIDTTPTGFTPADQLLTAVADEPDKPLAWWLHHAPVTARTFADALVQEGVWDADGRGPLRRYRDALPQQRSAELSRLGTALRRPPLEAGAAATALLLDQLRVPDLPHGFRGRGQAEHCGAASWLAPDLVDHLERWQEILEGSNRAAREAYLLNFL
ncbi:GPP34 family phosphoprotein [uncultured Jatrophihabitans sp.]|uniref:GPP34 family phosphoprotein n=1 Tax=uncultured Jatrophihabitans sp. TaxID=1610747 RepID=UPI0035CA816B